jgi:two-component system, chemotaxis family, chemotaxis protein CheY
VSPRILAVDDSASLRQAVAIALIAEGFAVTQAADGAEGLAKATQSPFDLVITDLNMPVMDGMELIRRLRALPAYAGKPILFLTTESDAAVKAQAKTAGATGWITKPFEPDRLVTIVRKVLAK